MSSTIRKKAVWKLTTECGFYVITSSKGYRKRTGYDVGDHSEEQFRAIMKGYHIL